MTPPSNERPSATVPPSVRLYIDEMVVHGMPRHEAVLLRGSIEEHLGQELAQHAPETPFAVDDVQVTSIAVQSTTPSQQLGRLVAGAIAEQLDRP